MALAAILSVYVIIVNSGTIRWINRVLVAVISRKTVTASRDDLVTFTMNDLAVAAIFGMAQNWI